MEERINQLTERQRQVLALIGCGKMTKEIAVDMGISENGVEYHRKRLYAALGIRSVGQAVKVASEMHLTGGAMLRAPTTVSRS
jgi:DNA-binding NarL/FixJ family response regulator